MPDVSACLNEEILLRVIKKDDGKIVWYNSYHSQIGEGESIWVRVTRSETYTAVIFNQYGSSSADLKVTLKWSPSITIKPDTSICHGESLDLNSCVIESTNTLQWTPDQNSGVTESGMYIATTSTPECGSASDTIYVNVHPPLVLLPVDSNLLYYNTQDFYDVRFQTLYTVSNPVYEISGTLPPGLTITNDRVHGQPKLGPADYNTHHLQVSIIDDLQCRTSKDYILAPEWKAANVLLPRGDYGNSVFLPDYDLETYNRNGLLMHKGMGWDGLQNNAPVPAGTYFYKVKILIDGMPEERMSYVVVMYY
jgi:hypothetical protein